MSKGSIVCSDSAEAGADTVYTDSYAVWAGAMQQLGKLAIT